MVAKEPVPNLSFALGGLAPFTSSLVELDPLSDQFFKRQDVKRFTNPLALASERVSTRLFPPWQGLPLA